MDDVTRTQAQGAADGDMQSGEYLRERASVFSGSAATRALAHEDLDFGDRHALSYARRDKPLKYVPPPPPSNTTSLPLVSERLRRTASRENIHVTNFDEIAQAEARGLISAQRGNSFDRSRLGGVVGRSRSHASGLSLRPAGESGGGEPSSSQIQGYQYTSSLNRDSMMRRLGRVIHMLGDDSLGDATRERFRHDFDRLMETTISRRQSSISRRSSTVISRRQSIIERDDDDCDDDRDQVDDNGDRNAMTFETSEPATVREMSSLTRAMRHLGQPSCDGIETNSWTVSQRTSAVISRRLSIVDHDSDEEYDGGGGGGGGGDRDRVRVKNTNMTKVVFDSYEAAAVPETSPLARLMCELDQPSRRQVGSAVGQSGRRRESMVDREPDEDYDGGVVSGPSRC